MYVCKRCVLTCCVAERSLCGNACIVVVVVLMPCLMLHRCVACSMCARLCAPRVVAAVVCVAVLCCVLFLCLVCCFFASCAVLMRAVRFPMLDSWRSVRVCGVCSVVLCWSDGKSDRATNRDTQTEQTQRQRQRQSSDTERKTGQHQQQRVAQHAERQCCHMSSTSMSSMNSLSSSMYVEPE